MWACLLPVQMKVQGLRSELPHGLRSWGGKVTVSDSFSSGGPDLRGSGSVIHKVGAFALVVACRAACSGQGIILVISWAAAGERERDEGQLAMAISPGSPAWSCALTAAAISALALLLLVAFICLGELLLPDAKWPPRIFSNPRSCDVEIKAGLLARAAAAVQSGSYPGPAKCSGPRSLGAHVSFSSLW